MNSKGFTAFADTMVFMVIMTAAISVTVTLAHTDSGDMSDPDRFIELLSESEVRLSDLTELDDDSLVFLTDVIAYSVSHDSDVPGYLKSLLDPVFGENRYRFVYSFGGAEKQIGVLEGSGGQSSCKEIPVSAGGTVRLELRTI